MLKVDLALILAAIASGALWIEQGHRLVIDAPAAEAQSASSAVACPDSDSVPYSVRCLDFLDVPAPPTRLQVVATLARPAPCPVNDGVPYSASCIAFLQGATATGMRWRVTDEPEP